jgi:hypothetical protein
MASSLCWIHSLFTTFLGRGSISLVSQTSCGLHCIFGFTRLQKWPSQDLTMGILTTWQIGLLGLPLKWVEAFMIPQLLHYAWQHNKHRVMVPSSLLVSTVAMFPWTIAALVSECLEGWTQGNISLCGTYVSCIPLWYFILNGKIWKWVKTFTILRQQWVRYSQFLRYPEGVFSIVPMQNT